MRSLKGRKDSTHHQTPHLPDARRQRRKPTTPISEEGLSDYESYLNFCLSLHTTNTFSVLIHTTVVLLFYRFLKVRVCGFLSSVR